MSLIFFIALPSTIGLVLLGKPIIELFFERGAFDAHSTAMTNEALVFYAMGLWAFSGIRVMVSGFYALQDTKTPVKVAFVALLANLLFSLLLMGPLKHGGLALALSLASALQYGLLVFLFKQKFKQCFLVCFAVKGRLHFCHNHYKKPINRQLSAGY